MLAKRVIPCLDVRNGRVVKGIKFAELQDAGDPAELAAYYDHEGADELVFLDITASVEGRQALLEVVARTADQVFIPLTVGGGISSLEDIKTILRAGADKVSINTAAVQHPELINRGAEQFGSQCIVVAIDARRRPSPGGKPAWEVYTHGGRCPTGRDVLSWAEEVVRRGAGEILLTSMDADGTRAGYDNELTRAVARTVPVPVIASGGAGSPQDLAEAILVGEADAVLAASIFHYRQYTIREVKEFLREKGIEVRLE